MRWLLLKDLRVLTRSRLLVTILVIYPVAIALLIGLAVSRTPPKPRVAIVDLGAPGETVSLGGRRVDVARFYEGLLADVDPIPVATVTEARRKVSSGSALAAVVIPADLVSKLSSGVQQGHVEVIYDDNALQQSLVHATIEAALSRADLEISAQLRAVASHDIDLLLAGGSLTVLGASQKLLGLSHIPTALRKVIRSEPPGRGRSELTQIADFAEFAASNLSLSKDVLAAVGEPIVVRSTVVQGSRTPLDRYGVVVAVAISLMFIAVLLSAGALASEREEQTLDRLVGGRTAPLSRTGVIVEKIALGAICSTPPAFAMLAGIIALAGLNWSGVGLWLAILIAAAIAFAALGTAIGTLAREVRAASLMAFMVCLPLALLALVPSGSVAGSVYDIVRAVSLVFPFRACLEGLEDAVNGARSPSVGVTAVHLLAIAVVLGTIARLALGRRDQGTT